MAVIILFIVSLLVFFMMRLLPGDPIVVLIGGQIMQGEFSEEQIDQLRIEYGLDKPMIVQYLAWLSDVFHGDLGRSILNKVPVTEEILRRLPITLHIGLTSFIIGVLIGIPAGIISAVRRGTWLDTVTVTLANLGITIPVFWLGFMMIYLFGLYLDWLPVQGYVSPFTDPLLCLKQIIMPVICLAIFPTAGIMRQTRSSMLDVMREDYIRTAWSKGLKEEIIITRHALKNGLITVVTMAGVQLAMIIGGSVIVETVFNIPGMGRLAVSAVLNQDYPYVQGIILIVAAVVTMINLIVDITYGWLDPRVKYE